MSKITEPYKCPFSISNEILTLAAQVAYRLGALSTSSFPKPSDETYASDTKALLSLEGIEISPSQMRGLNKGGEVPSHPLATALSRLYRALPDLNPCEQSFLERFEEAVWTEGVPHRLSRRVASFPYPIPMHARIPDLLKGLFSFAKNGQKRIHPFILAALLYFETLAIMPYSEHNELLAALLFKTVLGHFDKIFYLIPLEKIIARKKKEKEKALEDTVNQGDTAPFVAFLLKVIEEGVITLSRRNLAKEKEDSPLVQKLLSKMEEGRFYSCAELCDLLGLKSRLGLRKNYIKPALEAKALEMSNPLSPTDRTQRYRKKEGR